MTLTNLQPPPTSFFFSEIVVQELLEKHGVPSNLKVYPTTSLQRAMFSSTLDSRSAYNQQICWKVTETLTKETMFAAWSKVIAKHDILQTCFYNTSLGPYQVVRSDRAPRLLEARENLKSFLEEDQEQGFDETSESWFRMTSVHDPNGQVFFVVTSHHLVYDGWTMGLLTADLDAALKGEDIGVAVSFERFVQFHENQDRSKVEAFWKEYLKEASPSTAFANVRAIPEGMSEVGTKETSVSLSMKEFRNVSRSATVATVFKAAWGVTMQTISQTENIVFGEVVSGRDIALAGIEGYVQQKEKSPFPY